MKKLWNFLRKGRVNVELMRWKKGMKRWKTNKDEEWRNELEKREWKIRRKRLRKGRVNVELMRWKKEWKGEKQIKMKNEEVN